MNQYRLLALLSVFLTGLTTNSYAGVTKLRFPKITQVFPVSSISDCSEKNLDSSLKTLIAKGIRDALRMQFAHSFSNEGFRSIHLNLNHVIASLELFGEGEVSINRPIEFTITVENDAIPMVAKNPKITVSRSHLQSVFFLEASKESLYDHFGRKRSNPMVNCEFSINKHRDNIRLETEIENKATGQPVIFR